MKRTALMLLLCLCVTGCKYLSGNTVDAGSAEARKQTKTTWDVSVKTPDTPRGPAVPVRPSAGTEDKVDPEDPPTQQDPVIVKVDGINVTAPAGSEVTARKETTGEDVARTEGPKLKTFDQDVEVPEAPTASLTNGVYAKGAGFSMDKVFQKKGPLTWMVIGAICIIAGVVVYFKWDKSAGLGLFIAGLVLGLIGFTVETYPWTIFIAWGILAVIAMIAVMKYTNIGQAFLDNIKGIKALPKHEQDKVRGSIRHAEGGEGKRHRKNKRTVEGLKNKI